MSHHPVTCISSVVHTGRGTGSVLIEQQIKTLMHALKSSKVFYRMCCCHRNGPQHISSILVGISAQEVQRAKRQVAWQRVPTIKAKLNLIPIRTHEAFWLWERDSCLQRQAPITTQSKLPSSGSFAKVGSLLLVGDMGLTKPSWPNLGQCLPSRSCQ